MHGLRSPVKVKAAGGDVLTELAGAHIESLRAQIVVQLRMHQMDLAEIRLGRIHCHPRSMLDRHAGMRVTFDTQPGDQIDLRRGWLTESVFTVAAQRDHDRTLVNAHGPTLSRHRNRLALAAARTLRNAGREHAATTARRA
jgi:hypothetical protein